MKSGHKTHLKTQLVRGTIAAAILAAGSAALGDLTPNLWMGLDTTSLSTSTDMTDPTNWSLGHVPTATEQAVFNFAQSGLGVNTNVGNLTIPAGFAAGGITFTSLNSGDGVSKLILNSSLSLDNLTFISNGDSSGGDMNNRVVLATTSNVTLTLTGSTPLDFTQSAWRMVNPGWVGDGGLGAAGGYQISVDGQHPTGFRTIFNLTNSNITFASPSQTAFASNDAASFTGTSGFNGTSQDDLTDSDNSVLNFTGSSANGLSGATITLGSTGARISGTMGVGAAQMNVRYDQTWIGDPTSLIRIQHRSADSDAASPRPFMIGSLNVSVDPITGAHTTDGTLGSQRLDNLGQLHIYVDFKNDDYGSSTANGMRIAGGTYGSIQLNDPDGSGDPMAMILDADVTLASNGVQTGSYTGDAGNVPATTTPYGLTLVTGGGPVAQNVLSLNGKNLTVAQGVWLNGNGSIQANFANSSNGETMQIDASGSKLIIGGDLIFHSLYQSANAPNLGDGIDQSDGSGLYASRRIGIIGDAGTVLILGGNFIADTASMGGANLSLATVTLNGGPGVKTWEVGDASTKTSVTSGPTVAPFEAPIVGGFSVGTLNIGDGTTAGNVQLVNNYINDNILVEDDGGGSSAGEKLIAGTLNILNSSTLDANGQSVLIPGAVSIAATGTLNVNGGILNAGSVANDGTFNATGTANVVGAITGAGATTVGTSSTLTATQVMQASLTINGQMTIIATPVTAGPGPRNGSATTSVVGALAIAGGATPTGKLNLNNNGLVITNGGTAGRDAAEADIAYARDGGLWDRGGITSSNAQAAHIATGFDSLTLGVILNSDLATPYTSFGGVPVNPNDVLIKFTYGGDANLNGVVNGDDYFQIDQGFVNHYTGWINGDFNHDGVVNGDDYFIIDSNFINQSGQLAGAEVLAHEAEFGPSYLSGFSASQLAAIGVPEPTSLALLGLGVVGLLARRRRA